MSVGHVCIICGKALKHQEQNPKLLLIFVTNFHTQIFLCKSSSERKTWLLWRAAYLEWESPQSKDKGAQCVVHLLWGLNCSSVQYEIKFSYLRTLIRFIFHALGWLISSWHQMPCSMCSSLRLEEQPPFMTMHLHLFSFILENSTQIT